MAANTAINVLLIEDSPSDVRLIEEVLDDAPYGRFKVISAPTLAKGLRMLRQTDVDAILLDLNLPDSQGIDTFHAVIKRASSLPVIVLTTADDNAFGQQMIQEGAQDYVSKDVLLQAMASVLLTHMIRFSIERKRADVALHKANEQVQFLNERLQVANEDLHALNNELRYGVQERTEELDVATEELRVTNEELRHEVEQRASAEQEARASAFYARNLVEASLDPFVTISAKGKITDVNKATEGVTGCSRDELIGSDFSDYFTEPHKARAVYEQVFTNGFVKDYSLAIRHKSGKLTDVQYNATVYRNDRGEVEGVLAAARDITDLKRAEEELQRYSNHLEAMIAERTNQLKNAERLAGIGETAAMIGHDLRNPLQAMQYMVDLQKLRATHLSPGKRASDDWQEVQTLCERMSEQIYYMDKIVSDLQDYARPIVPEREEVAISAFIDDVLDSLPRTEGVQIVTDVDDLTVKADARLMQRVFSNLVLNAMQALPNGGTLTISATSDDEFVVIRVSDTGIGIPPDIRDKIFSPLTTGKAKGTGLGLAVVKRIVEAHNGTITFESEERKGTTFTVTLPQTAAD